MINVITAPEIINFNSVVHFYLVLFMHIYKYLEAKRDKDIFLCIRIQWGFLSFYKITLSIYWCFAVLPHIHISIPVNSLQQNYF